MSDVGCRTYDVGCRKADGEPARLNKNLIRNCYFAVRRVLNIDHRILNIE